MTIRLHETTQQINNSTSPKRLSLKLDKNLIEFSKFQLDNGLRVLVHEDRSTPMVAVNVLYDVGSRDEKEDKTGFAHLFEHLMFGGSENIQNFDSIIQMAGGENNAFTNNDITDFYEVLPAKNLEIALWLESDRMHRLRFDQEVLDVQRKVVVEEFNESCLNQPYGNAWHHIANLVYKTHPYRWPTIGLVPEHIVSAKMDNVQAFFESYYHPSNAILTVSGNVQLEEVTTLVQKWFGSIPERKKPERKLPTERPQNAFRALDLEAQVPADAIYLAFRMPERSHPDFYAFDLLSDLLCNGRSSRLYRKLLRERDLFSQIDCYVTGSLDPGLFIIEGKLPENVSLTQAEQAIWEEIDRIKTVTVPEKELQKVKNRVESNLLFSETSVLNKAINLAFFELLDMPERINEEAQLYAALEATDIKRCANSLLNRDNCSTLRYISKK